MTKFTEYQPTGDGSETTGPVPSELLKLGANVVSLAGEVSEPVEHTEDPLIVSMRKRLAILDAPQFGSAFRDKHKHGRE